MTHQLSTKDVFLENRLARFLHSVLGEEGKLWRRANKAQVTIFSIDEANAFSFTLKVFYQDPRITILTFNQEADHGTPVGSAVRCDGQQADAGQSQAS